MTYFKHLLGHQSAVFFFEKGETRLDTDSPPRCCMIKECRGFCSLVISREKLTPLKREVRCDRVLERASRSEKVATKWYFKLHEMFSKWTIQEAYLYTRIAANLELVFILAMPTAETSLSSEGVPASTVVFTPNHCYLTASLRLLAAHG